MKHTDFLALLQTMFSYTRCESFQEIIKIMDLESLIADSDDIMPFE